MIELIQLPWSPFCLVQRRILEFADAPFKTTNIPPQDRTLVWKLTRERYYGVPILKDGKTVVFETSDYSQVIAKYIDAKFQLGLFPRAWAGIDRILWRHVEEQIEDLCFRLNDSYFTEFVAKKGARLPALQGTKIRRGCLDQWRAQQASMIEQLTERLMPFELMLAERPYLVREEPHFVDFDLWGMLANFLYTGHHKFPTAHTRLHNWFGRLSKLKRADVHSEKLHP
jgi:glutathione S-transferase